MHVLRNNAGFFTTFCSVTSKQQALRRMCPDKKHDLLISRTSVSDSSHSYHVKRSQQLVCLRVQYLLPFESNQNRHTNYAAVQIASIRFHNNPISDSLHIYAYKQTYFDGKSTRYECAKKFEVENPAVTLATT